VCQKARLRAFFQLLSSSGFRARRRRDFFVTLFLSRYSESHECVAVAYFGLINVFPVTLDACRLKIEIFLSWAYPELKTMKITHFDPMRPCGSISTSAIHFIISKTVSALWADATEVPIPKTKSSSTNGLAATGR